MLKYDYSQQQSIIIKPYRGKKPVSKLIAALIIVLTIIFFIFYFLSQLFQRLYQQKELLLSPLINNQLIPHASPTFQPISNQNTLLDQIKILLSKTRGTYSVYIFNLNEEKGFGINEKTIYTAASVNKIPILVVLYYLADKKQVDLDKTITLQKNDIQDYGTGKLRYEKPGSVYSLKTLAKYMIENSDNTAAYILGEEIIGMDKIQKLVNTWGLTQTNMKENKTSSYDMALLFAKIYKNEIANQALTEELLDHMDDSEFEDRIPMFLPKNIKIYHKIGTEIGNIHDAGVINIDGNPYYLGVFSNDITDEKEAKNTIATISKIVYDFQIAQKIKH